MPRLSTSYIRGRLFASASAQAAVSIERSVLGVCGLADCRAHFRAAPPQAPPQTAVSIERPVLGGSGLPDGGDLPDNPLRDEKMCVSPNRTIFKSYF